MGIMGRNKSIMAGPALQRGPGGPRPTQHFRPDDVIVTWRNR